MHTHKQLFFFALLSILHCSQTTYDDSSGRVVPVLAALAGVNGSKQEDEALLQPGFHRAPCGRQGAPGLEFGSLCGHVQLPRKAVARVGAAAGRFTLGWLRCCPRVIVPKLPGATSKQQPRQSASRLGAGLERGKICSRATMQAAFASAPRGAGGGLGTCCCWKRFARWDSA